MWAPHVPARPTEEPQALSGLCCLSVLQLVNRLGSTRGGVELSLQSPALRTQEEHCQERIAVVEGRCSHEVSAWLDPPCAWAGSGGGKPSSFPIRVCSLKEGH